MPSSDYVLSVALCVLNAQSPTATVSIYTSAVLGCSRRDKRKQKVSPEDWLILTQERGLYISSTAAAANIAETERLQDGRYSARLLCSTER